MAKHSTLKELTMCNILHEDGKEYLQEAFIRPMLDIGFSFTGHSFTYDKVSGSGIHTLMFEAGKSPNIGQIEILDKIIHDNMDDNQPYPMYSLYLGTAFILIPYIA